MRQVCFNGAWRYEQALRDFAVPESIGDQPHNRSLRRRQALPSGRRTSPGAPSSAMKSEGSQGRLHAGNVPGRAELLVDLDALANIGDGLFPLAILGQRRPSRFASLGELVGSSDRPVCVNTGLESVHIAVD